MPNGSESSDLSLLKKLRLSDPLLQRRLTSFVRVLAEGRLFVLLVLKTPFQLLSSLTQPFAG